MAMSDDLVAVGSQSHVSLVDPRCQAPAQDVPSLDMDHGERPPPSLASRSASQQCLHAERPCRTCPRSTWTTVSALPGVERWVSAVPAC